jgi:hypothetical protein
MRYHQHEPSAVLSAANATVLDDQVQQIYKRNSG